MSDAKKEEVLSAAELDELVEQSSASGFDDGEFRTHDFSGGEFASMAKWTDLTLLAEKHAEALGAILSSEFGCEIAITCESSEFARAGDLLAAFPQRLCLVSTPAESLNAELHLLIPGPLLTTLVNQYFGGGALLPPEMMSRVTPSEQRIGERVSKSFFRAMDEIWSGRLPLKFGDLFVDITPDRFAMNARDTGFVVLPFLYQLGAQEAHVIRLLVPFSALDANAEFLTPKVRQQEKCELNSTWEPEIRAVLPDVTVEVRGEVFELKATLRTLLEMQVGTSIPITEPRDVKLFLGDEAIAHGIYGGFDGFKAMQFSQFRESNS